MTPTLTPTLDLVDHIRELTTPHTHTEHYTTRRGQTWYGANHTTRVPALLVQLAHATPSGHGDDRTNTGYVSRPAARLEALDCLDRIDREAAAWAAHLGHDRAGRDTLTLVRLVGSLAPGLEACDRRHPGCCDAHGLEHDVRRWWTQARITSGWDSPAWRPDNTCPACGERGGLRVRLAEQVGFCADCGATWDRASIGVLADHIRAESESERVPRPGRVACYCPVVFLPGGVVARPVVTALRLCPACGSARCVHALAQQRVEVRNEGSGRAS